MLDEGGKGGGGGNGEWEGWIKLWSIFPYYENFKGGGGGGGGGGIDNWEW